MLRTDLVNLTQRQFDDVMRREAIEVEDYYTNETYKVLFRKSTRGAKSNDSVIIFYPQDTNIQRGTMFVLKGEKYVVMTKDALESDVYFTSGAFRCNAEVIVYEGTTSTSGRTAGWYHKVPFVVNSLTAVNPSGSFVEVINGNLSMYTSKQDFLNNVNINNEILDFGGRFEVVNNFFLDGIQNVYLRKEQTNSNDNYCGILYFGDDLHVGDTIELHSVVVNQDNYSEYIEIENPTYSVTGSNVATIEDGILTLVGQGTFTITLTNPVGGTNYTTPEITVGAYVPPEPGGDITWTCTDNFADRISVNNTWKYSFSCTPSETTEKVPTFKYFFDNEEYPITDFQDMMTLDMSDPYKFQFSNVSNDLTGYDFYVEAWVDGVKMGQSKTARFVGY